MYETQLKLKEPDIKGNIEKKYKEIVFAWYDPRWIANKINTVDFIKWLHVVFLVIAIIFLFKSVENL
jgi:hypothetical protein